MFFMISLICIVGYSVSGFFGIGCCIVGFLSIPVTLGTINFFAAIAHDSHFIAKLSKIPEAMTNRLFWIAWAVRNYGIFLLITNNCGVFLINFLAVGAILVLT